MNKIKTNDTVIVISGKDKGATGKVQKIIDGTRVLVENVNMVKKHVKGNPNTGERGGIIPKESPMHISNVALLNPVTNKADRVGIKTVDGKKVRYFKSNDELVDML